MQRARKFVAGLLIMFGPLLLALAIPYAVTPLLDIETRSSDWYAGIQYVCVAIVLVYITVTCVALLVLIVRLIESGCNMVISACQGRGSRGTTEEAVERNN